MPTVQRRVLTKGKIRYRALVRIRGYKPKTATFLKRADAVAWGQEIEARIRQSKYFPDRLIESEKYTLNELMDRYKSEVLPRKRDKKQKGLIMMQRDSYASVVHKIENVCLVLNEQSEIREWGRGQSSKGLHSWC